MKALPQIFTQKRTGSFTIQRLISGLCHEMVPFTHISSPPEDMIDPKAELIFFTFRNPLDAFASWCMLRKYSHGGEWAPLSIWEIAEKELPTEGAAIRDLVPEWLGSEDKRIHKLKFCEYTADLNRTVLALNEILGTERSEAECLTIATVSSFKNATGGRKVGMEDKTHHHRKGIPGDHVNVFTPEQIEHLKDWFGRDHPAF